MKRGAQARVVATSTASCVPEFGQCGLAGRECCAPHRCFRQSRWYSQCGSACPRGRNWDCSSDAPSVGILVGRWGGWPAWTPVFLRTLAANPTISFLLLSEEPPPKYFRLRPPTRRVACSAARPCATGRRAAHGRPRRMADYAAWVGRLEEHGWEACAQEALVEETAVREEGREELTTYLMLQLRTSGGADFAVMRARFGERSIQSSTSSTDAEKHSPFILPIYTLLFGSFVGSASLAG